jgi:hypothetical protein
VPFSKEELEELRQAKLLLENPGLAAKLASYVGSPVEKGMKLLPKKWQAGVHSATEKALMKALDVAVRSLANRSGTRTGKGAQNAAHRFAVATSGAVVRLRTHRAGVSCTRRPSSQAHRRHRCERGRRSAPHRHEARLPRRVRAFGQSTDARDNAANPATSPRVPRSPPPSPRRHLAQKGSSAKEGPRWWWLVSLIARFGYRLRRPRRSWCPGSARRAARSSTRSSAHYQTWRAATSSFAA